jgi:hypothetical protein
MMKQSLWFICCVLFACEQQAPVGQKPAPQSLQDASTIEKFLESYARIRCEANARCCRSPKYVYSSLQECQTREYAEYSEVLVAEAVKDGRLRYDPSLGANVLEDAHREGVLCYEDSLGLAPFVPSVASGGDCSGTMVEQDGSPFISCEEGLYCQVSAVTEEEATGRCTSRLALDAPCTRGPLDWLEPCVDGAYCSSTGRCKRQGKVGDVCDVAASTPDRWNQCHASYCGTSGRCENSSSSPSTQGTYCFGDSGAPRCSYGGGASGGTSESRTCESSWVCTGGGARYGVQCETTDSTKPDAFTCTCTKNTAITGQFQSVGFCGADMQVQAQALVTECSFTDLRE